MCLLFSLCIPMSTMRRQVVEEHGADVARLFTLFKAPPEKQLEWDERALQGQKRWMDRLQQLVAQVTGYDAPVDSAASKTAAGDAEVLRNVHGCIHTVTEVFEGSFSFNGMCGLRACCITQTA